MTCLAGLAVSIYFRNNMNEIYLINNIILHEIICFCMFIEHSWLDRFVSMSLLLLMEMKKALLVFIGNFILLENFLFIFVFLKDLNAILKAKNNESNWLCPIESKILIWSRQLNDPQLKQRFDFIISADWFVLF
jgi:hypothetical protein